MAQTGKGYCDDDHDEDVEDDDDCVIVMAASMTMMIIMEDGDSQPQNASQLCSRTLELGFHYRSTGKPKTTYLIIA